MKHLPLSLERGRVAMALIAKHSPERSMSLVTGAGITFRI
jgi:hypothetical protein